MNAASKLLARGLLGMSAFALAGTAQAMPQTLQAGEVTHMHGVQIACAGIGQGSRGKPRWDAYPLKIEAVGGYGQYLAGETVTVQGRDGMQRIRATCDAPWVLMNLHQGHYRARVNVPGAAAKTVAFYVPAQGQRRVVVRFPGKMAGAPPHHATWQRSASNW